MYSRLTGKRIRGAAEMSARGKISEFGRRLRSLYIERLDFAICLLCFSLHVIRMVYIHYIALILLQLHFRYWSETMINGLRDSTSIARTRTKRRLIAMYIQYIQRERERKRDRSSRVYITYTPKENGSASSEARFQYNSVHPAQYNDPDARHHYARGQRESVSFRVSYTVCEREKKPARSRSSGFMCTRRDAYSGWNIGNISEAYSCVCVCV